jgi:beta propeller repeat protein
MYDLSTHKETQITTNESWQLNPDIYGDRIIWEDNRNGNCDLYLYDLSTSREIRITTNDSDQFSPAIYGDRIVWKDYRNGNRYSDYNPDIYMYDLSTSRETRITTNESLQEDPAIYGDRIVWTDWRNGNTNIYMCTVSGKDPEPKIPVANFSTNITSGNAPLFVQFTDLSQDATGRNWDFENDGIVDSTYKNQVHEYTVPGY